MHTSGLLFWVLFSMICPPVAYLYMTLVDFFAKKQQKAFARILDLVEEAGNVSKKERMRAMRFMEAAGFE